MEGFNTGHKTKSNAMIFKRSYTHEHTCMYYLYYKLVKYVFTIYVIH